MVSIFGKDTNIVRKISSDKWDTNRLFWVFSAIIRGRNMCLNIFLRGEIFGEIMWKLDKNRNIPSLFFPLANPFWNGSVFAYSGAENGVALRWKGVEVELFYIWLSQQGGLELKFLVGMVVTSPD